MTGSAWLDWSPAPQRVALMRSNVLLMTALPLVLMTGAVGAQTRPAAPAANCLDAREVVELHQPTARTLAVMDRRGARHRISLASTCALGNRDATLVAPHGWVCGARASESVRVTGLSCGITQVRSIDAREFAALARASSRTPSRPAGPAGTVDLAPIEVIGTRRRGFGGTFAYCLSPAQMRAWSEDSEGLRVEVRASRSGGNRFYRVELGSSCSELGAAQQIALVAGAGNGLVCGNAGDRVINVRDPDPFSTTPRGEFAGRLRSRAESEEFGCPVTAVYPLAGSPGSDAAE